MAIEGSQDEHRDIVDEFIQRAAEDMSREVWPGLENIHPTPEDMERVK